jgi:hypothetical protein
VTRDGHVIGTLNFRRPQNVNWQPIARIDPPKVRSLDGTVIASGRWWPNPAGDGMGYDDTFVLNVTAVLNAPRTILVLVWGLTMPYRAHVESGGDGG